MKLFLIFLLCIGCSGSENSIATRSPDELIALINSNQTSTSQLIMSLLELRLWLGQPNNRTAYPTMTDERISAAVFPRLKHQEKAVIFESCYIFSHVKDARVPKEICSILSEHPDLCNDACLSALGKNGNIDTSEYLVKNWSMWPQRSHDLVLMTIYSIGWRDIPESIALFNQLLSRDDLLLPEKSKIIDLRDDLKEILANTVDPERRTRK